MEFVQDEVQPRECPPGKAQTLSAFRQPERARVNSRVRKQRLLRRLAEGHAWRTSLAKLTANSLARVSPPLDKDVADGPAFSTDVTYEPHKLSGSDCLSVP